MSIAGLNGKHPVVITVFTVFVVLYFTYLNLQKLADPKNIVYLPNVQHNESEFSSGKNIFFIVSTLSPRGEIKLTARQACAIESAARTNLDWKIFSLFVSATWFNALDNEFISPLLRYGNIHLRTVGLETFASGTPLEDLFARHALQKSSYPVEHTSDVLRLLVLYKYGGTYLDTDVVVRKSFDLLQPNFLGSEGQGHVANGVINLQAAGYGHRFAEACINDLAHNFNGTVWAANGPFLVTRNLRRFCNVSDVASMSRERCGGQLTVHPPDVFYRIRYPRHEWFFEPERTDAVMAAVKDDVLVHVWNKATGEIRLQVDGTTAYVKLAHEFCPRVVKACDTFF